MRHPNFADVYNNTRNKIITRVGTVQIQLHKEALLSIADVALVIARKSLTKPKVEPVKKKGPVEIVDVVAELKPNMAKTDRMATEKKLLVNQMEKHKG